MFCTNCGNKRIAKTIFCTKCGNKFEKNQSLGKSQFYFPYKKFIYIFSILIILIIFYYFYNFSDSSKNIDYDITSTVVNIYCEDRLNGEISGGSGTIFSEDGLILTNAHIIPESARDDLYIDETTCLVTLPDPSTGAPDEIYYAYPIFAEGLSDEYDLAFMQIHDVFFDNEEGVSYGEYPKKFPAYTDNEKCSEEFVKLGEPITVYGYPSISGGYALTVTDGIVSSLLQDEGLIITSAKISYGNSGGLAVDKNNCMVGIPSMVMVDENESLGVIISNDLINEFINKLKLFE